MDIFFIVDKTNALLKATGWSILSISLQENAVDMQINITVYLNGEPINTTQTNCSYMFDDVTLEKQNIIVGNLHNLAITAYTKHENGGF